MSIPLIVHNVIIPVATGGSAAPGAWIYILIYFLVAALLLGIGMAINNYCEHPHEFEIILGSFGWPLLPIAGLGYLCYFIVDKAIEKISDAIERKRNK